MFSLEALDANQGDCLFLHFGTRDAPQLIIIDGGPQFRHPVFNDVVKPRLQEMAQSLGVDLPLNVSLLMVSHVDDDHIGGVIKLMDHANVGSNPLVNIDALWHNSFDDFLNTDDLDTLASFGSTSGAAAASFDNWTLGIAASINQGRTLRQKAQQLGIVANAGASDGFVNAGDAIDMDPLQIRILGPSRQELESLQEKWDRDNPAAAGLSQTERLNALAAFTDESVANISSIVAYVKQNDKTMLLTGDARGDKILEGLRNADLLENGRIELDILKVPHHGSDRNVSTGFFEQVLAKHYVFSADGQHHNPDIATLVMLTTARGDSEYTMWFTHDLQTVRDFVNQDRTGNTRNYCVRFRASDRKSLSVDLEEPLDF